MLGEDQAVPTQYRGCKKMFHGKENLLRVGGVSCSTGSVRPRQLASLVSKAFLVERGFVLSQPHETGLKASDHHKSVANWVGRF